MILTRFDLPPSQPLQLTAPLPCHPAQIHVITGTLQSRALADPTSTRLSLITLDLAGATGPTPAKTSWSDMINDTLTARKHTP